MRIIADLANNYQQLDDILDTIAAIKCDYIKLQYYSDYDLYGTGSNETKLDLDWMPEIYERCKKYKIKLMCTVFNPDKVADIDKWVAMHKVASSEITDKSLLEAIKKCKKPTLVSTGGASSRQINDAINTLDGFCAGLLACDVEYPSKRHSIRRMMDLGSKFPTKWLGYSDHSLDIYSMPILVQHYGATYYEKHVKPNLTHPSYEAHALTISEFNEMVDVINGKWNRESVNPHQRVWSPELHKWVRPRV
jgi:sialic acid synthase SpsE